MYSVQCTVYSVQCTVYSVQCTVYSVQCTVYSVQCTVYSVQCTVYSVQCIVYKSRNQQAFHRIEAKEQRPITNTIRRVESIDQDIHDTSLCSLQQIRTGTSI